MDKEITNIVFTKNRPLQLEGYLESLYRHFSQELFQTYILYKSELFSEQYQQLFQRFPNCKVIEEKDFFKDFFDILNQVNTKFILFGIDDVVYFDSVDFDLIDKVFKQFSEDIFGFSLRFSEQVIGKDDPVSRDEIAGQPVYSINWPQGKKPITRYPFELCATIYKTELVKRIIRNSRKNNPLCEQFFAPDSVTTRLLSRVVKRHKLLKIFGYFYNPNTLESWNCRWCQNHSEQLPGRIYFQKFCASAIQVNMVNTSTNNESDAGLEYAVETLAEKYSQGYRLDIDALVSKKPMRTHCGKESFVLAKR